MIFPFRSSSIFRSRWIALLWAVGICFMASEIVDSVSGVTGQNAAPKPPASSASARDGDDPVAAVLEGPPAAPPPEIEKVAR